MTLEELIQKIHLHCHCQGYYFVEVIVFYYLDYWCLRRMVQCLCIQPSSRHLHFHWHSFNVWDLDKQLKHNFCSLTKFFLSVAVFCLTLRQSIIVWSWEQRQKKSVLVVFYFYWVIVEQNFEMSSFISFLYIFLVQLPVLVPCVAVIWAMGLKKNFKGFPSHFSNLNLHREYLDYRLLCRIHFTHCTVDIKELSLNFRQILLELHS